MPATLLSAPPQLPTFENVGNAVAATSELTGTSSELPAGEMPAELVATAHEAVEVVLRAADQVASREQRSVNLTFAVGENDLSVRVELHGNEVRTTFRTDSSELRAALSQEWQSVAHASGDRAVRIAPAVFATSDQSAFDASSGDASSRQREQHASQTAADAVNFNAPRSRGNSLAAAPLAPASQGATRSASTSRHLHTLA